MKQRGLSKDTWEDPTFSLTMIREREKQLTALFQEWGKVVLALVRARAMHPVQHAVTNVDGTPFDLIDFFDLLLAAADENLYSDADPMMDDLWTEGTQKGIMIGALHLKKAGIEANDAFTDEDRDVIKGLSAKGQASVRDVATGVNKDIVHELTDTFKDGGNIDQDTLDNIQTMVDDTQSRAEMIARTETMDAVNTGAKMRYENAGVEQVEWLTVLDERACTRDIEWDGQVYAGCEELDGMTFPIDNCPPCPAHPNCLLPETRVESPCGVIAGLRVRYDGPTIEIIVSNGGRVTVTPNHLLLTDHGFVEADRLYKGDKVFYRTSLKGIIPGDPDNDWEPPTIKEVIASLTEASNMPTSTMPPSTEDLHGDGRLCYSDINIVRANGFLSHDIQSSLLQYLREMDFDPSGEHRILSGAGPLAEFLLRAAFATDGCMSGTRKASPFFWGRPRHTEVHGFAPATRLNPELLQSPDDKRATHPQNLREVLDRFTGLVELQEVVEINILPYHGEVFDLETLSTLCIANSFVVSNCRCTILPIINIPEENQIVIHGSASSGNWGHAGRPGLRGGSAPGGCTPDEKRYLTGKLSSMPSVLQMEEHLPGDVQKYRELIDKGGVPAIRKYVGLGYTYVNRYLREGMSERTVPSIVPGIPEDQINDEVAEIHRAIINAPPLPKGTVVWRGMGFESGGKLGIHTEEGDLLSDKAFQSFSTDPGVARGFAGPWIENPTDEAPHQTIVRAVLDGKVTSTFTSGLHTVEHEVLFDKGQSWKVTKVEDVGEPGVAGRYRSISRVITVVPA